MVTGTELKCVKVGCTEKVFCEWVLIPKRPEELLCCLFSGQAYYVCACKAHVSFAEEFLESDKLKELYEYEFSKQY